MAVVVVAVAAMDRVVVVDEAVGDQVEDEVVDVDAVEEEGVVAVALALALVDVGTVTTVVPIILDRKR
jgi:hypothetical protein